MQNTLYKKESRKIGGDDWLIKMVASIEAFDRATIVLQAGIKLLATALAWTESTHKNLWNGFVLRGERDWKNSQGIEWILQVILFSDHETWELSRLWYGATFFAYVCPQATAKLSHKLSLKECWMKCWFITTCSTMQNYTLSFSFSLFLFFGIIWRANYPQVGWWCVVVRHNEWQSPNSINWN